MKALGKKMLAVMKEVGPVAKDARNEFHKYDYVSDAAIVRAIRDAMINHGLVLIPHHLSPITEGDLTKLPVEYTLLDTDSGESIKSVSIGFGSDKGDKGIYKASTGAEKYYLTKTFLIPTADDPENEKKPRHSVTDKKPTWEAPKLSTQIEKPKSPVTEELRNIVRRNVPSAEIMVDEILDRLNQEADGDEEQVKLLLKEATMNKDGTKWLQPESLRKYAEKYPDWIDRIHTKIVTK